MMLLEKVQRVYWRVRREYPVRHLPATIYGLSYRPTIEPLLSDGADFLWPHRYPPTQEISEDNRHLLFSVLSQRQPRVIVEIGVARHYPHSFTKVIFEYKRPDAFYLGIDRERKPYLDNPARHIHLLQADSMDHATVRQYLGKHGIDAIDLLLIDGDHSVTAAINDWCYADLLSAHGVVVLHDTNAHPGPRCLYDAVDPQVFVKSKYFTDCPDNGMAVLVRQR